MVISGGNCCWGPDKIKGQRSNLLWRHNVLHCHNFYSTLHYVLFIMDCRQTCKLLLDGLHEVFNPNTALTNSDLTDAAVESSRRDIVAGTAGLPVCDRKHHTQGRPSDSSYSALIPYHREHCRFSQLYTYCFYSRSGGRGSYSTISTMSIKATNPFLRAGEEILQRNRDETTNPAMLVAGRHVELHRE